MTQLIWGLPVTRFDDAVIALGPRKKGEINTAVDRNVTRIDFQVYGDPVYTSVPGNRPTRYSCWEFC